MILGLGIVFELPILVFFLALFGIVSSRWLWKNIRYAILVIFIIAGIITPTPDPLSMCLFATPMLMLYLVSIGVAHMVHPDARNRKRKRNWRHDEAMENSRSLTLLCHLQSRNLFAGHCPSHRARPRPRALRSTAAAPTSMRRTS